VLLHSAGNHAGAGNTAGGAAARAENASGVPALRSRGAHPPPLPLVCSLRVLRPGVDAVSVSPQTSSSQRPANVYDVRRYTPPQEDLGVVTLPENMQNGDSLELNGKNWVVSRVSTRFKLLRGRYRKDGARLFVTETSRWLVDGFLQQLYEKP
jgi:hypothetical protein